MFNNTVGEYGSGFPFNPGRHPGGPFTPYKENITDILAHTDDRLEGIRVDRASSNDTLTASYVQQLIDGGVLPGTENYVSADDKYKQRLEERPIREAQSDEEMARRLGQYENTLGMLRTNAAARRDDNDEALRNRMSAMLELQAANRLNDRPNTIMAFKPEGPIDLTGGGSQGKGNKNQSIEDGFILPELPKKIKQGKNKEERGGSSIPDFEKNPSFDGGSFDDFIEQATANRIGYTKGMERELDMPAHPSLSNLYNKLANKGMTEDDMYRAAQVAGLTNVRTGKEGKSDFRQMVNAYENDFYQGMDDNEFIRETREASEPKDLRSFDKTMDEIERMFGGKFKFKTYKEALKGNKASEVNQWVKDYIDLGGGVGRKVTDAIGI